MRMAAKSVSTIRYNQERLEYSTTNGKDKRF